MIYINGADLNQKQLLDVKNAYKEAEDPFWVERHNFPFSVDGELCEVTHDVQLDEPTLIIQREDFIRDYDKDARYELPRYASAFVC